MQNELMNDSEFQYDEVTYKDPMTLDINLFSPIDNLITYEMNQADVLRPDLFFYEIYRTNKYDDIVLWINGLSSTYELTIGYNILIPTTQDLEDFYIQQVK